MNPDRWWWLALLLITLWVAAQLTATTQAIQTWRSEPSLWCHAHRVAPQKPRAALNCGRALMLAGRYDVAERAFYRTLALSEQPHVPAYDRADAVAAAQANLQTLNIMRAIGTLQVE